MTDLQEQATEAGPELLHRGRYSLTQMPDGSIVINRAMPICERCESCGCGEAQEQLPAIPAALVPFITGQARLTKGGAMAMLGQVLGGR